MQRIITTAAAVLLGAGILATTAKADMNYGPTEGNNGQCWKKAGGSAEMGYGYWAPCAKPAAATPTVHHRHAKKS